MAYPADHSPPHVHATMAGVILVLNLLADGVVLDDRKDAVSPSNAPRNVVNKIQRVAADNVETLWKLWEDAHGTR